MMRHLPATAAAAMLSLTLGACSIGPLDPHAVLPTALGAGASLAPAGGPGMVTQSFVEGATTPPTWWQQFSCPALNGLADEALSANNDIAAADASLRAARAQAAVAGAALAPGVDLSYTPQRARTPASLSPPVADSNQLLYSLHTAQVTVSYPLDLFGELRARRRSAVAAAKAAQARLLAARESVVANLVVSAVTRAQLADQIEATRATMDASRDILHLTRQRRDLGAVGDIDVTAQEAALAAAEAALPALDREEARQRNIVAVLLGRAPGTVSSAALPPMRCFTPPASLPVALPADVVRYRPDIIAAAAGVEGAAQDARAAVAARFPSLTLSASGGGAAQNFGDMFQSPNLFWSIAGGITAPLFHAGALHNQQRAAVATFDASKAQYRAAVLRAFADVADALQGLHDDAIALEAAERGLAAAERTLTFVRRQQQLGDVGTLAVLSAENAAQQARTQAIFARAARLVDSVALFQANGAAPSVPENNPVHHAPQP